VVVEKRVVMKFMGREGLNFLILMGKGKEFMRTNMGIGRQQTTERCKILKL
jgi:hypothetical protein